MERLLGILEILVGVCRAVLQILTRFQTKICNYPQLFSDWTSKIHISFQTWLLGRNYVIIIRLERSHKTYSNPLRIRIFLFLSYSLGIETMKMFIHSGPVVPSKTQPRFQTKMDKVYTVPFSDQNGATTLPDGAAHVYGLYKAVPRPPPRGGGQGMHR